MRTPSNACEIKCYFNIFSVEPTYAGKMTRHIYFPTKQNIHSRSYHKKALQKKHGSLLVIYIIISFNVSYVFRLESEHNRKLEAQRYCILSRTEFLKLCSILLLSYLVIWLWLGYRNLSSQAQIISALTGLDKLPNLLGLQILAGNYTHT